MALEPTIIRPRDLVAAPEVYATDDLVVDNGASVLKAKPSQVVNVVAPVASEAEALAGTDNVKRMTALRVKQAIDAFTVGVEDAAVAAALEAILGYSTGSFETEIAGGAATPVSFPVDIERAVVFVNGILFDDSQYTIVGDTLTPVSAWPVGTVRIFIGGYVTSNTLDPQVQAAEAAQAAAETAAASIQPYGLRATMIAATIPASVTRVAHYIDPLVASSPRSIWYMRKTGATTISDFLGWVPDGFILDAHFGAAGDYSDTTDTGTDAYAALNAAMTYAATLGEFVWITGRHLTLTTLTVPNGCRGFRATEWIGGSILQTGAPAWPASGDKKSPAIIGGHTTGPVIRLSYTDQEVGDGLEIGATAARNAAAIGTGDAVNVGVLAATVDSPSTIATRIRVGRIVVRNQPGDGIVVCGDIVSWFIDQPSTINCGRHGLVVDNGETIGRTNKVRPGIGVINQHRSINTGGHSLCIGHPSGGSNGNPYRVTVIQHEGIRVGNNPAHMHESAGTFILGEQVTVLNSAAAATSGFTGATPTYDHAWAIGGRHNSILDSRAIRYVAEPIKVLDSPFGTSAGNDTLKIDGLSCFATPATPSVHALLVVSNTSLDLARISGDFTGSILDESSFTGSARILTHTELRLVNLVLAGTAPQRLGHLHCTYGGTANAITLTYGVSALTVGLSVSFTPTATNTGATTINLDGLGAVACVTVTGAALPASYIRNAIPSRARYNGTNWVVDRQPERGGDSTNGYYVRYANGHQECWHTVTANLAINNAFFGGFRSSGQTTSYPVSFSAAPMVSVEAVNATAFGACSPGISSAFSWSWAVTAVTSVGTADPRTVQLKAAGFWY